MKGSTIDPFGARSLEEGLDADVCVPRCRTSSRRTLRSAMTTLIQWETCCLSDRGLGDVDGMGRSRGDGPSHLHGDRFEVLGCGPRLARPMRSARAASTLAPVRINSMANPYPSRWTARWVPPPPGMRPRLISGNPKVERSETIRMSQEQANSMPPPSEPIHHRQSGFARLPHDLPDVPVVEDAPDGGTVLANEFGDVRSRTERVAFALPLPPVRVEAPAMTMTL